MKIPSLRQMKKITKCKDPSGDYRKGHTHGASKVCFNVPENDSIVILKDMIYSTFGIEFKKNARKIKQAHDYMVDVAKAPCSKMLSYRVSRFEKPPRNGLVGGKSGGGYYVFTKAKGEHCYANEYHNNVIVGYKCTFLDATQGQYDRLIYGMIEAKKVGLEMDYESTGNIFYDKKEGFTIVDFDYYNFHKKPMALSELQTEQLVQQTIDRFCDYAYVSTNEKSVADTKKVVGSVIKAFEDNGIENKEMFDRIRKAKHETLELRLEQDRHEFGTSHYQEITERLKTMEQAKVCQYIAPFPTKIKRIWRIAKTKAIGLRKKLQTLRKQGKAPIRGMELEIKH